MQYVNRLAPGHRAAHLIGILMTATAALMLLLLAAPAANADETGCPGGDPTARPESNLVEASMESSGTTTTYKFKSVDANGDKGVPGLIEYCVYYPEGEDPTVKVDETPKTGAEGWDGTFFEDPPKYEAFGFQRGGGNESNIPFDGTTRTMGTATWPKTLPATQVIVLHINDEAECDRLGLNSETCFVTPGTEPPPPPADNLTASKTAVPVLQRQYEWEIEKEVDATKAEISGGKATFTYTVTVTETGHSDSGWYVKGEINVNNPNSGAVEGVDLQGSRQTRRQRRMRSRRRFRRRRNRSRKQ